MEYELTDAKMDEINAAVTNRSKSTQLLQVEKSEM